MKINKYNYYYLKTIRNLFNQLSNVSGKMFSLSMKKFQAVLSKYKFFENQINIAFENRLSKYYCFKVICIAMTISNIIKFKNFLETFDT